MHVFRYLGAGEEEDGADDTPECGSVRSFCIRRGKGRGDAGGFPANGRSEGRVPTAGADDRGGEFG